MSQTATAQNPRRTAGWSPERRAKQSAMMRARKIWLKSTGPRTKAGKARSSQNAAKPDKRLTPDALMHKAAHAQRLYILEIKRFIAMKKIPWQNELLKAKIRRREKALIKLGNRITADLIFANACLQLCKNLDFSAHMGQIVNAFSARPMRCA